MPQVSKAPRNKVSMAEDVHKKDINQKYPLIRI